MFTGTANAATVPAVVAFPVVGNVSYIDDFGAPRPQGPHQGNDIMSIRHQPAVAFEGGRVQKHITSSGNCMLYLHGASGMTYVYIHLNNDLTASNDNRAPGCRNGVAYAPGLASGQTVKRGQLVGYVGDSGDADGIQPHLHFEVRTPTGRAIDPYQYLRRAMHLLYPRPAAADPVSLTFKKATLLVNGDGTITIRTTREVLFPYVWSYPFRRNVVLTLAADVVVEKRTANGPVPAELTDDAIGKPLRVWTQVFVPSWTTQRAPAGLLVASRILLGAPG